jgi:lipoprotein-releasing system permease protein
MIRAYEWFIGTRYLRSGHRNRFISFISLISMLGISLGVATLIVVLSVMNGFEKELRQRILSMTSHATLLGERGFLDQWRSVREGALEHPEVVAAAPYVEGEGMLINGKRVSGATIRGVVPEQEKTVGSLATRMTAGDLDGLRAGEYRIVLGSELAAELQVGVGDSVVLVVAKGNTTPLGVMPRMRRFRVSGLFNAGMYEYDRGLALVSLADAARVYRLDDRVTGVRLAFRDLFQAPALLREIAPRLEGVFYTSDWTQKHANFFRSIEYTKAMMFVILLLIVAVAAFNIVSTLVMVVKEKQSDIAILRTVGAQPRSVLAIFIVQGAIIGLLGTLAGVALGVLLSLNLTGLVQGLERVLNTRFMDAKVYFMSELPALVETSDVMRIAGTAFALCCLSTLYPAWRAARTQPAEALRHE